MTIKKPKLSVIIPVYNGESLIENCLSCLLSQTLKGIEIIFVDDASTDGTFEILKSISTINSTVVVIHLEKNKKQGAARNAGLLASSGEYIAFLDVDDTVPKDMYLELYNLAKSEKSEVADSDYYIVRNTGEELIIQSENDVNNRSGMVLDYGRLWTKIFKRELFISDKCLLFPEGIFYEDNYVQAFLALKTSSICKVNKPFYRYWVGSESTTRASNNYKIFDRITSANLMYDDYLKSEFNGKFDKEMEYKFLKLGAYNTCFQVAKSFYFYPKNDMKKISHIFNKTNFLCNPLFSLKDKVILCMIKLAPRIFYNILKVRNRLYGCN